MCYKLTTHPDFLRYVKCYSQVYQEDVNDCDNKDKCGKYKFSAYYEAMDSIKDRFENITFDNETVSLLASNFTQNACE